MMPAFLLEKVMWRLLLSLMNSILIFLLPVRFGAAGAGAGADDDDGDGSVAVSLSSSLLFLLLFLLLVLLSECVSLDALSAD